MEKLTLTNWKQLQPYIEAANHKEYNSNIMTMLMWSEMYATYFECRPHFALLYSTTKQGNGVWLLPQCKVSYRHEALEHIHNLSKEYCLPFEIHSMTREFKDWLQQSYPDEFLIQKCIPAADYVYDRQQQQTLIGKKMQKRRNHFHVFEKMYENCWYYKPIEKSDLANLYDFLKKWQTTKPHSESIHAEEVGIRLFLEHCDILPIKSGCIYIDNKLEAFIIASQLAKDTIQIHVEKANRSIRGLSVALLKCFLETLDDDIIYINREDDMGDAALRKAKRAMHPIQMIEKFVGTHKPLQILPATKAWLPQIQKLWLQRFTEENETTTDYFFTHCYNKENCLLLTCENELIAMVQLRPMPIVLQGKIEEIPFVLGVATRLKYEGCGYMKQLLEEAFHIAKQKGYRFLLLQAYNWDIYKPFGFYEAYAYAQTKLDKQYYTNASGYHREVQEIRELLIIYQAYTAHLQGYRLRNESYYKQRIAYDRLWQKTWLVHIGKQADAYACYYEDDTSVYIEECCYLHEDARDAMLSLFCKKDKQIYVCSDTQTMLVGKRKLHTNMMVKELSEQSYPSDALFIHEEL